jgi:predicted membrane protein
MITGLSHTHAGLRWIILILLIVTIVRAFINRYNSEFGAQAKLGLFSMIAMHIQLLVGFGLYMSGELKANSIESISKFINREHVIMMIVAVILGTLGHSLSKRAEDVATKYRKQFIFFGLSFVIIMAMIPWPCLRDFGDVYNWF